MEERVYQSKHTAENLPSIARGIEVADKMFAAVGGLDAFSSGRVPANSPDSERSFETLHRTNYDHKAV
jgi:hypothetical protein